MPTQKKKKEISFTTSDSLRKKIDAEAQKKEFTRAALVRLIVATYFIDKENQSGANGHGI